MFLLQLLFFTFVSWNRKGWRCDILSFDIRFPYYIMYHTLEYNNDNDADDSDDGGNIIYNKKKIELYLLNTQLCTYFTISLKLQVDRGFDRHTSPEGLVKIRLFQKLSAYFQNHLRRNCKT